MMAVVALLGGCALPQVTVIRNQPTPAPQTTPAPTEPEPTSTQAAPVPDHPVKKRPGYPYTGANKWRVAPGTTPIRGEAGPVLNYQVAVEQDITGLPVKEFARQVVKILGDERS